MPQTAPKPYITLTWSSMKILQIQSWVWIQVQCFSILNKVWYFFWRECMLPSSDICTCFERVFLLKAYYVMASSCVISLTFGIPSIQKAANWHLMTHNASPQVLAFVTTSLQTAAVPCKCLSVANYLQTSGRILRKVCWRDFLPDLQ